LRDYETDLRDHDATVVGHVARRQSRPAHVCGMDMSQPAHPRCEAEDALITIRPTSCLDVKTGRSCRPRPVDEKRTQDGGDRGALDHLPSDHRVGQCGAPGLVNAGMVGKASKFDSGLANRDRDGMG
jgi:hypothetical protein